MFCTYGLIDPRDGMVFYVGQSAKLKERLRNHNSCDPANPSYHRVMDLRRSGIRFHFCIFGEFGTRHEAMRLERSLALFLDGLVNAPGKGLLSENKYPTTKLDGRILASATQPMPAERLYSSIINADEAVSPIVHRDGAYE